jgi:hypothetical protein
MVSSVKLRTAASKIAPSWRIFLTSILYSKG